MKIFTRFKNLFKKDENMSDGYHTFKELYRHRDALFLNLCKNRTDSWWSYNHSDGTPCFGGNGWIIVGIGKTKGRQITYHMNTKEIPYWEEKWKSRIREIPKAHKWDLHTPEDVILRLNKQVFGG